MVSSAGRNEVLVVALFGALSLLTVEAAEATRAGSDVRSVSSAALETQTPCSPAFLAGVLAATATGAPLDKEFMIMNRLHKAAEGRSHVRPSDAVAAGLRCAAY